MSLMDLAVRHYVMYFVNNEMLCDTSYLSISNTYHLSTPCSRVLAYQNKP